MDVNYKCPFSVNYSKPLPTTKEDRCFQGECILVTVQVVGPVRRTMWRVLSSVTSSKSADLSVQRLDAKAYAQFTRSFVTKKQ